VRQKGWVKEAEGVKYCWIAAAWVLGEVSVRREITWGISATGRFGLLGWKMMGGRKKRRVGVSKICTWVVHVGGVVGV